MGTSVLYEYPRQGEYLKGIPVGEIGGVLFERGLMVNSPAQSGTILAKSTVAGATNGLLVPWDPSSADAGTKVAVGVLHTQVNGGFNQATVQVGYLARGPQKVTMRDGRMPTPVGSSQAAMTAALAPLGIILVA